MLFIPLNDSTEARYAEIARKMLETGNWVTLQHDYGVPFWAKPPLSTWLSAISMKLFGVNAFAARLPSLLLSLAMIGLVGAMAKTRFSQSVANKAMLILASTLFFLVDAGTVMTDASLLFSLTLIMTSFWQAVINDHQKWRYGFFIGVGLGLLAKGPLTIVLSGIPIFLWVLFYNQWKPLWHRLPWMKGTLLTLAIALPWYILAELRTPGFLNYYLIGEHFHRFVDPAWQGDKYGFAHSTPHGMIWIFALIGLMPWSAVVLTWLVTMRRQWLKTYSKYKKEMNYLLCCFLTPLIFFTFASNIIWPYVFPCLPSFALILALWVDEVSASYAIIKRIYLVSAIPVLLLSLTLLMVLFHPQSVIKSHRDIIENWQAQPHSSSAKLLYWASHTDYSAQFYAHGRVAATLDPLELEKFLAQQPDSYLVINKRSSTPFPDSLSKILEAKGHFSFIGHDLYLYHVKRTSGSFTN